MFRENSFRLLQEATAIYEQLQIKPDKALQSFDKFLAQLVELTKDESSLSQFINTEIVNKIVTIVDGLFGAPTSRIVPNLRLAKKIHAVLEEYYPTHAAFIKANYLSRKEDQISLFNATRLYFKLYTKHSFPVDAKIFTNLRKKITHRELIDEMAKMMDDLHLFNTAKYHKALHTMAKEQYALTQSNLEREHLIKNLTPVLIKAGQKGHAEAYLFLAEILENHSQEAAAIENYENVIAIGIHHPNKYLADDNARAVAKAKSNLVAMAVETKKNYDQIQRHLAKLSVKETIEDQRLKGKEKANSEDEISAMQAELSPSESALNLDEEAAKTFVRYYRAEDEALLQQLIDAGYTGEWLDKTLSSTSTELETQANVSAAYHCDHLKKLRENAKSIESSALRSFQSDFVSKKDLQLFTGLDVTQTSCTFWATTATHSLTSTSVSPVTSPSIRRSGPQN